MDRRKLARAYGRRPFHLGDLERYGLLALAAALVLGVAYLLQALDGRELPFKRVEFAGSEPGAVGGDVPTIPESFLDAWTDPRVDAPGGGETSAAVPTATAAGAPAHPARREFDFFEPPVRLPGRPAPIVPTPPGAESGLKVVVIQKGETLQKIAARELGSASAWRKLVQANPGIDPRRMRAGDELKVPLTVAAQPKARPTGARAHLVKAQDTLRSIAEAWYGDRERWIDLLEANRDLIQDPAELQAGMTIRIP